MAYLLGWKDVLRPIRDGYRHLFPSPDTGPTPEERRKQRALDRLKGFAYFDTFEQLETWTAAEVDPLQQSNTPLLVRSNNPGDELGKASVLLCHDYAGNYHDYEAVSCVGLEEEQYTCEHLQYVDTFIYFSHKFVCVPPPAWTNTLHRNGVKTLGTILVEPQTPDAEKLLKHGDDGLSFPLASKLAEVANYYGFDGWLVNIEKPFPNTSWNTHVLEAFLRQLRSELGDGKQLVWYDALTTSNKVSYQNRLNAQNIPFAKACGKLLTNYCWKESDATDSIHEALQKGLALPNIYFGIDVWAQNTTKLSHPRVTYPEYGGGGTNTGVAIAKLAELGLSAGIFAPAWTFEHFPDNGRDMDRTVWDGTDLAEGLSCSCGDCSTRHQSNKTMPVANSAMQHNAGSETFFFTDFNRAFSTHSDKEKDGLFGGYAMHAQLGSQSVLPVTPASLGMFNPLWHRVEDVAGRAQLVVGAHSVRIQENVPRGDNKFVVPLFKLNMPADGSLRFRTSYRDFSKVSQGFGLYWKISGKQITLLHHDGPCVDHLLDLVIDVPSLHDFQSSERGPCLEEVGFYSDGFDLNGGRIAELDYICIQPMASHPPPGPGQLMFDVVRPVSPQDLSSTYSSQMNIISDISTSSRGEGETRHLRLCWKHASEGQPVKGMPYSRITGPFAYFSIFIDGLSLGRAYTAEHVLPAPFAENLAGREVPVTVKGVGFDGQELATASARLHF